MRTRDHMDEYQLALKVFREEREAVGGDEPARKKPRLANYVKQLFATLEALTESKDKEVRETQLSFLASLKKRKGAPPIVHKNIENIK